MTNLRNLHESHPQVRVLPRCPLPHAVLKSGENSVVDLARIGWLATVLACLIAVVILVLQGYYGYAGVTLAVAISAATNLA